MDGGTHTSSNWSPCTPANRHAEACACAHQVLSERFIAQLVNARFGSILLNATVVGQVGLLFIPVSMILDLLSDPAAHALPQPARDAICAHHEALAGWFRRAASWVRSGEGAAEVSGALPKPPDLSGRSDHLTALVTWYGLLDHDIRDILEDAGPQAQSVISPSVGGALHAAG
jgi:hypothetical protein